MNPLFNNHPLTLETILNDVKIGRIGLPDLQRPFVWEPNKIRNLFDSLLNGYPIGFIMLWETPDDYEEKTNSIGDNQKSFTNPKSLIIDGQQRLTALLAAVYGIEIQDKNYKKRRIKISYNPLKETNRFDNWTAAHEGDPEWIPDISTVFKANEEQRIGGFREEYIATLNASRQKKNLPPIDRDTEYMIERNIGELVLLLVTFSVPVLEITRKATEEDVSEIFVRVNSGGQTLNENNFILTLLSVYANEDREAIDKFCAESRIPAQKTSYNNHIQVEPVHVVRMAVGIGFRRARLKYAYMILRGKDLDTGLVHESLRKKNLEIFNEALHRVIDLNNWHAFLNIVSKSGHVSNKLIAADNAIVFSYILYLIAKYDFGLNGLPLICLFRCWFFMAALTSFFSQSTETAVEVLFADIKKLKTAEELKQYLYSIIDTKMTDDFFNITLPQNLESSSAINPSWYAYNASLIVLNHPMLFSTEHLQQYLLPGASGIKNSIDKHHLFPKEYLSSIGIDDDRQRNQIANYTFLDYNTNIFIADKPPMTYAKDFREKLGEDVYNKALKHHALPDDFEHLDYASFLQKRRILMAQIIRQAYELLRQE